MGEALLAGLIKAGEAPSTISFVEKRADRAAEISAKYGAVSASFEEVAAAKNVLIVVKPQDFAETLAAMKPHLSSGALLISFAAGKTLAAISSGMGADVAAIRVMPNTPTLVGLGMAGISPNSAVTADQLAFVVDFLNASGQAVVVPEEQQDAVTATSGSGPAYFFAFVEAMVAGAVKLGLSEEVATTLTVQTLLGAGAMLDQTGLSATKLRENVTSPNGTTAAALATFNAGGLADLVSSAMLAAAKRSQELA